MKKTIRDRSIFAVVACIAMAAIMFFYSTQPAPVRLPQDIRDIAMRHGMKLLREDGWAKAFKGLTSVEEVMRVTEEENG